MLEASFLTALTFISLFAWWDLKKIAGFGMLIDIGIFILNIVLFHGTYAGMMTGVLSGLMITVFLRIYRKCIGYKRPGFVRRKNSKIPVFDWIDIKP